MFSRFFTILLLSLSLLPNGLSANENQQSDDLKIEDKLYGLSLLWKEAGYNFANFDLTPDLDFDAAYQEAIPRVLATKNRFDYYRELQRFMAQLKDGHTGVYLPEGLSDKQYYNWAGIWPADVAGEAVIVSVDKAVQDKVPLGSRIISVNGTALNEHLNKKVIPFLDNISTEKVARSKAMRTMLNEAIVGNQVTITIKTPTMKVRDVKLTRDTLEKKRDYAYLDVDMPFINNNKKPLTEFRWLEGNMAYMALNGFHDEDALASFKHHFAEIQKADALILDLRKNGGGLTNIGTDILSYLIKEKVLGAKWKTPKHIASYKAWGMYKADSDHFDIGNVWESGDMPVVFPQDEAITIPTYVLIGRQTASAAEDFLVYTDKIAHFTTIGENTFGSTGQPLRLDLPGGGRARICTKRDTYPDGRDFVGVGIKPDILVEPGFDDVINERDVVLQSAMTEARKQIGKR